MLLRATKFGRTQQGNNNAYCQDNEISWVDWDLTEKNQALTRFVQKLTALRHKYPILRRNLFLSGQYSKKLRVKDVTWINANGEEMQASNWVDTNMSCFGMLLDGRAQTTGIRQRGHEATLLIVVNGYHDLVTFTLPECPGGNAWLRLIDTNLDGGQEESDGNKMFQTGDYYDVTARSLLLFVLEGNTAKVSQT